MSSPISPAFDDHLVIAARWIEAALLGSIATVIAIVAIAAVGLGMLGGRIDLRRGSSVVVGCFILFGAPTIAGGLISLVAAPPSAAPSLLAPPASPLRAPTPAPHPTAYDPYAGAAVPADR